MIFGSYLFLYPSRDLRRLLRVGGQAKRQERGAKSKNRDYFLHVFVIASIHSTSSLAPSHLITRSARNSTDCGIVRLSAFAVFRLITNSNFVGCSTGRSAGFVPFKILST